MKLLWPVALLLGLLCLGSKLPTPFLQSADRIATGARLSPIGTHTGVGSYPVHIALTQDRKWAVVSTMGFREKLSLVRTSDGSVVDSVDYNGKEGTQPKGLYFGLAIGEGPSGPRVYVSEGALDQVSVFDIAGEKLVSRDRLTDRPSEQRGLPYHFAGLALDTSGRRLVVVANQTGFQDGYKGALAVYDTASKSLIHRVDVGGFPYDVACLGDKAYVSLERDGAVAVVDVEQGRLLRTVRTGAAPANLLLDRQAGVLYVANSASDTVSVVRTDDDKVLKTVLLRPAEIRGLPGATPLGLALADQGRTLLVACAGLNAVAQVDARQGRLKGFIPTGWWPTDVAVVGDQILVTSAKGVRPKVPNATSVNGWGTYIQDIYEGTLSSVQRPDSRSLAKLTTQVLADNFVRPGLDRATREGFTAPPVQHVIYVVKENRTYDNVLGDLPKGNGQSSLCLFPRRVTPNQHALAERFVTLDNFHCCAEVSQDGWVWSTAGMVSAYASRNTPYNYSDRGRNYDTEGSNNGVPVDLIGLPDVARPASGYLWEACAKHGVSFRNYGFFSQFQEPLDKRNDLLKDVKDNAPTKKALVGQTDVDYRRYDLEYPDGDAYSRYGWSFAKQRKAFGSHGATSRFGEFRRDFGELLAAGRLPRLMFLRMGTDHTAGTRDGMPSPESMVAENDYAVGQLVEMVSHSSVWKSTVICVLEDDAQSGIDHVDAHRSTAYVVSPYIARGTVDSSFYNTDSMLRTIELLLGLPPMSQFDATATPFQFFSRTPGNEEPYDAILPDREVVCKANSKSAYRSGDSARVNLLEEESEIDVELNDILWGAVKGAGSPRPH